MRSILIALLALASTSCGHKDEIDPEFHPYVDSFMKMCAETSNDCKMYNFSIEFVDDIPGDPVGLCSVSMTRGNEIQQKVTIEKSAPKSTMIILVWHELQHCLRFQEHTEGDAPHVMRPYILADWEFSAKPERKWLLESFDRDVRYKKD